MKKGNTMVVVGGAGYIGSVMVSRLVEHGVQVVVVDTLEKGHRAAVHPSAALEVCDIRDRDALDRVFDTYRVDGVFHFGAYSLVAESVERPGDYFRNNVFGGQNLLDIMLAHGVKKIVFSSTAAVYGNPEEIPIVESTSTRPINAYGRSKLAFEFLLQSYAEAYGLRYAVLRYFNAAGATNDLGEDHGPETHLIPLVLQVPLKQREHITIFGTDYDTPDGTCVRDYIHVVDLIQAHMLAFGVLDEQCVTYNLGNGTGYSVREVINTARTITGHGIPAVEADRRPGDPPRLVASSNRLVTELGWQPQFSSLESIIRSAWDWHRNHPDGYPS